jgi:hypothetical protein
MKKGSIPPESTNFLVMIVVLLKSYDNRILWHSYDVTAAQFLTSIAGSSQIADEPQLQKEAFSWRLKLR